MDKRIKYAAMGLVALTVMALPVVAFAATGDVSYADVGTTMATAAAGLWPVYLGVAAIAASIAVGKWLFPNALGFFKRIAGK